MRNCVARSIHDFFQERGFLYIHTPIITAAIARGPAQLFQVTTLDLGKLPRKDGAIDFTQDFFAKPSFLTVSGQLEGEIFACALGKIYTFGPTFRAENSNTTRHLAEFWMVEPEMAFYELNDNMDLAEAFLKRIFRDVLDQCPEDMQFFNERIDKTAIDHACSTSSTANSSACRTPRRSSSCRNRARRSSSPWPGASTCKRSTSAT